jgi:hypothetical protein
MIMAARSDLPRLAESVEFLLPSIEPPRCAERPHSGHNVRRWASPQPKLRAARSKAVLTGLAVMAWIAEAPALAQTTQSTTGAAARAGAVAHALKMQRLFPDIGGGSQATPSVIPELQVDPDPGGAIASFQPGGRTITAKNAFFQDLGSNGRTCFTCHQPQDGWAISAKHVRDRFRSDSNDPLFRLVDGATCPSADVSTPRAKRKAYSLLRAKGLIRVGLPMPSQGLQFQILDVKDPYGCNTDPTTGLTGSTTGIVSVYRRPLPSANLGFLSTIMWDGREPDLFSQARDATLGHAQATVAPTAVQQQQVVTFEGCTNANNPDTCAQTPVGSGVFTAQIFDDKALFLNAGAKGGPVALARELKEFFIGINDPLGGNPTGAPFTSEVFKLYDAWNGLTGDAGISRSRKAIARGEELFNNTKIDITGVGGLNDALNQQIIPGFCGTCHDAPNVGNHSVKAPLNIGAADAGTNSPPALDIAGLPVLTLVHFGPVGRKNIRGHGPGPRADYRPMCRRRQVQGTNPARTGGACSLLS